MKPQVFDRLNEHLFAQLLFRRVSGCYQGAHVDRCGETVALLVITVHVCNGSIGRPGNLLTVISPMITLRFFFFFVFSATSSG